MTLWVYSSRSSLQRNYSACNRIVKILILRFIVWTLLRHLNSEVWVFFGIWARVFGEFCLSFDFFTKKNLEFFREPNLSFGGFLLHFEILTQLTLAVFGGFPSSFFKILLVFFWAWVVFKASHKYAWRTHT